MVVVVGVVVDFCLRLLVDARGVDVGGADVARVARDDVVVAGQNHLCERFSLCKKR